MEVRESNDSYWSNLREGGRGLIEKSREQGRQGGRQVWISPPAIPSPPCSRFLQLFFLSLPELINHIRADIYDPKQVKALHNVFLSLV